MKNLIPTNIVRIVFALTIAFFGVNHLTAGNQMAGMLHGWPMALALVYISGLCLLLAAVAFIINKKVKLAGYLLALLLVIIVVGVHVPGMSNADPMMKMLAVSGTIKDTAIAMGALVIANETEK